MPDLIQDLLTRPERLRLDCLAMSVQITGMTAETRPTFAEIMKLAQAIEDWTKKAKETVS